MHEGVEFGVTYTLQKEEREIIEYNSTEAFEKLSKKRCVLQKIPKPVSLMKGNGSQTNEPS